MTLSNFVSKLNWRLIVIHLIACWFFIYSFQELFVLHDFEFLMMIGRAIRPQKIAPFILYDDMIWSHGGNLIGLLAGFLISFMISVKQHWYWVNSLIVFLIAYLLLRFHLSGWQFLRIIFLAPGGLSKYDTIGFYLINGLVMLIIGLLLFFLPGSIHLIKSGKLRALSLKQEAEEN
jgi:hypothetical protein